MHFLDPYRPRLGGTSGLPLLQGTTSRVVVPCLHVSPRGTPDNIQMEVSVFLPMPSGGASRKEILLSPDEFLAFWNEWLADPEATAKTRFNWNASPQTLDLDDIFGGFV